MDPSNPDLVARTAALAHLEISADEARTLGPQFARILEHFRELSELDVDGVEPMTGPARLADVTRPDEPRPSWARDALLANAPDARDEFYGVPKTVGADD